MSASVRLSLFCSLAAAACGDATSSAPTGARPDAAFSFDASGGDAPRGGGAGGGEGDASPPMGGLGSGGAGSGGAAPGGKPETGGDAPAGGDAPPGGTIPVGGDEPAGGTAPVGGEAPQGGAVPVGGAAAGGSAGGAGGGGSLVQGGETPSLDAAAADAAPPESDAGAPPESDAGAPMGDAPSILGEFSLREISEFSRFGFDQIPRADITAYFRDYSVFPSAAQPRDIEGPCVLFQIGDANSPGRYRAVSGGSIDIVGGVVPITLRVDPRTFDYTSNPPADQLDDLWLPRALLQFSGPGSASVGPVQRDLAAPDDVEITAPAPDALGALTLRRAQATLTWTAGNGDAIIVTLSNANANERVECSVPDDGQLDIPAPALAWFAPDLADVSVSVARIRERAFDTGAPRARATLRAERVRILERVTLE